MPPSNARIYVGNLPNDVKERDVEDVFTKYGKIKFCDIKGGRGPLYAFVEFEDVRDAEDAVRGRDGYDFDGSRLRVEFTRGQRDRNERGGGRFGDRGGRFGDRGGRFGGGDRYGGDRGGRGNAGGGSRRTNYRVVVSGLPATGSWQDLKDHMREAGEVCFTDVFKDGTGVVEYQRYDDVKYAIKKLDDTKFRSHEGETSYITVKEDNGGDRRSRSRSRSRSRTRSPAARRNSPKYSPRRSASRSVSASPRPSRSPSRSRSRS